MKFYGSRSGNKVHINPIDFDVRGEDLERYVSWMKDPEVIRFLYSRNNQHDSQSLRNYIDSINNSDDSVICGIFANDSGSYIGNICISAIFPLFKYGRIGYMIGDKKYWGIGCGTEAVRLICEYGFYDLGLRRIQAGCNELNHGSELILKKNGFICEGTLREHEYDETEKRYTNHKIYGLLREEFEKINAAL